MSRDDYDRRQGGFSNRGNFSGGNQQMRGNRSNFQSRGGGSSSSSSFGSRGGRDGNMRGGKNF